MTAPTPEQRSHSAADWCGAEFDEDEHYDPDWQDPITRPVSPELTDG